jgi:hypothetical protein
MLDQIDPLGLSRLTLAANDPKSIVALRDQNFFKNER